MIGTVVVRAFLGAIKTDGARRGPTKGVAFGVRDGHDRVIERALDISLAFSGGLFCFATWFCHNFLKWKTRNSEPDGEEDSSGGRF